MENKIWIATGNNIFTREIKQERKIGDFVLPEMAQSDLVTAEIISCTSGYFHNGSWIAMEFVQGDIITYPRVAGAKINLNGQEYLLTHPEDIIGKLVVGKIEE